MIDDDGFPHSWTPAARREVLEHEREQRAVAEAKDWRTRELSALRRRVRELEHRVSLMPDAVGEAVANLINKALQERAPLAYRGTWNAEEDFARNSLATYDGGMWLAIGTPTKGRRPKADPNWRLVVKTAPDGGFA